MPPPAHPRFALLRKLWHNFTWIATAGISRQFSFFVVNAYLFSRLSQESLGAITLAFGYLVVFVGISDFGLRQTAWREIARRPQQIDEIVGGVLSARAITSSLATLAYMGVVAAYWHEPQQRLILLIYALGLFFNSVTFDFPFLGLDRMDKVGTYSLLGYAYYTAACLITVQGDAQAWLVPVHFVVANVLTTLLFYRDYRRNNGPIPFSFRMGTIAAHLRGSLDLAANGLLVRITTHYPVLLIGALLGQQAVAQYKAPELWYLFGASFGVYLGSSTFTRFASLYVQEEGQQINGALEGVVRLTLSAYIPAGFLFITLLPDVLKLYVKELSSQSIEICAWLGVLLPFAVLTRYLKSSMPSLSMERPLLIVNITSIATGILCGLWLTSSMGIKGMVFAIMAAEAACLAHQTFFFRRRIPQLRILAPLKRPLVCTGLLLFSYLALGQAGVDYQPASLISAALFGTAAAYGEWRELAKSGVGKP